MALADIVPMPWLRRLDLRTVLAIALAAGAAGLVLAITTPEATVPILVAETDLQPGIALAELDVGVREVREGEGLVVGDSLGDLEDWTLSAPISSGEPILPSLLRPPAATASPNLLSISVDASHAVLGRIGAGDNIDIYATFPGRGGGEGVTELLAADVYVVEARVNDDRIGSRDSVDLLLAVDDELASALARAVRLADLDLVRKGP